MGRYRKRKVSRGLSSSFTVRTFPLYRFGPWPSPGPSPPGCPAVCEQVSSLWWVELQISYRDRHVGMLFLH